ncbi:hypothetical protein H2201_004580 [Coniosporium apollinis]|uniref:NAD dependent epimerase/dehydratase n=2 Tax=Coniosporium TaxID=2810619 RepID=A0ABQ9NXI4_9PEZI|nr:hypothetical protein H2199_006753 [Cladosporium sp. JES 115]KAJ9665288.1 hypothetical protein H2201_004580 [Coniosporium apollinis]
MQRLKEAIYGRPKVPPRVRTKPMQVLCVGISRSATESLAVALRKLGLETYHGWDMIMEDNARTQQDWNDLTRRKYCGEPDGDVRISTAEFDKLLGHAEAVVDIAGWAFAPELIAAYPDAKVILNTRRDLDAWHRSMVQSVLKEAGDKWFLWFMHFWTAELFWSWELFFTHMGPGFYRSPWPNTARAGILHNGKWVYREHCNMIRGLVPKERLLEWSVEDGWEPICKFLGKEAPKESFPHANNPAEFKKTIEKMVKPRYAKGFRNLGLFVASSIILVTAVVLGMREGGGPWNTLT